MKHLKLFLTILLVIQQCQTFLTKVEAFGSRSGDGFIRVRGTRFLLNGSPYYANGFNAYWLMYMASDPSQRYLVSNVFREASSHSLSVARTWAFNDGGDRALTLVAKKGGQPWMDPSCLTSQDLPLFLLFSLFPFDNAKFEDDNNSKNSPNRVTPNFFKRLLQEHKIRKRVKASPIFAEKITFLGSDLPISTAFKMNSRNSFHQVAH